MSARITNAQVMSAIVALNARLDSIAPATGNVASSVKTATAKPRTMATKADLAAGRGFPCAKCGRQLRTAKRAAVCGDLTIGHLPR